MGSVVFIDTSVFIAILAHEADGEELAEAIAKAKRRMTSPIVRLEACIALATRLNIEPSQAAELFDDFVAEAEIVENSLDAAVGASAVECFERFGKGRHRARLNIADCLVYASAKAAGAKLLFKGDDFSQTDVNTQA